MTDVIRKQYKDLKSKHPDALLLFRCGDFYETYEDDAVACSNALGITLTRNTKDGSCFAGFPYHALDTYLPKLIRAGHRVAICDQLEEPKAAVKRGISELVKPMKITLPALTQEQYNLLCECVRYRCADNVMERAEARKRGMFTGWYDDMDKQFAELKTIIYKTQQQ